jgi:hypothetical protein
MMIAEARKSKEQLVNSGMLTHDKPPWVSIPQLTFLPTWIGCP